MTILSKYGAPLLRESELEGGGCIKGAGLSLVESPNWSGKMMAVPWAHLGESLKRTEVSRTGIYVLTGPDPERPGGVLAYIGEADDVAARLRIHMRSADKDFFTRLAIVVSSDQNLTKAHVRFLESRVIRMVRQAGAVRLANGTEPDFQRLPEADRADMEFFAEQLDLLLPLAGFDLFRRSAKVFEAGQDGAGEAEIVFVFSTVWASATATETDDGFVVLAGSTARRSQTGTFPAGYLALRDQLVADGRLVDGLDL